MNRVNQVYNDDLAITMRLRQRHRQPQLRHRRRPAPTARAARPLLQPVRRRRHPDDDSDDVLGGLDFCDSPALGENRNVLGLLVGASNYDIGHIASASTAAASRSSASSAATTRLSGCTGLPEPKGDFFAIDYVAHEMGHQFSGNHTFNGTQLNCSLGNREGTTSVEPGSGSSVMAYAGICRQDNLQEHSDPYFSQRSVDEVTTYTEGANYANIEVQTARCRDFDGTDSIAILLQRLDAGHRDQRHRLHRRRRRGRHRDRHRRRRVRGPVGLRRDGLPPRPDRDRRARLPGNLQRSAPGGRP